MYYYIYRFLYLHLSFKILTMFVFVSKCILSMLNFFGIQKRTLLISREYAFYIMLCSLCYIHCHVLGFYCLSGATTPNDTLCTVNHYCVAGSATPTPCPPGSFSNATGNIALSNCEQCTPGFYCSSSGITGPCDPGFYCPAGQSSATPANYTCPKGHYCPGETGVPIQCQAGTYQDATGRTFCKACPAGK
jgi:hypothetical protein